DAAVFLIHVEFTEGEPETYALPLTCTRAESWQSSPAAEAGMFMRVIDAARSAWIIQDGMTDADFARRLLQTALQGRLLQGETWRLTGRRISADPASPLPDTDALAAKLPDREQSNSNVVFGEQLI